MRDINAAIQGEIRLSLVYPVFVDRLRLRWLDIETATWSDPEIVEVEWEGGHEAWGDRGRVRLESPRTAVVAVLEVID